VNTYETLFIIHPELEESEIEKSIEMVQDVISTGGGKILKVDKWGKQQLAYMIQKKREGYYVLIYFEAPPTLIVELNRRYKLADTIIRNLVVQLNKFQISEIFEEGLAGKRSAREAFSDEMEDNIDTRNVVASEVAEELVASSEG
jgi:small subunit ribosomal protein S6